jgi:hypothetical protein
MRGAGSTGGAQRGLKTNPTQHASNNSRNYPLFRIIVFGPNQDAPTHIFENGRKYIMASGIMVGNDSVSIKYSLERNR